MIVLNIDHWGGGVTGLWNQVNSREKFDRNSHCDGMLEVIGLSDVLHMGQVQVGMDEPFMVGQGRVIKIKSK